MRSKLAFPKLIFAVVASLPGISRAVGAAASRLGMRASRWSPSGIRKTRPLSLAAVVSMALAAGAMILFSQGAGVTRASTTALTPLAVSQDTGEKPQSKVWQYNNTWWAVLPNSLRHLGVATPARQ